MSLNGEASGAMDKGFTIKPPRGWLHKDDIIMKEGVTFEVRVNKIFTFFSNYYKTKY